MELKKLYDELKEVVVATSSNYYDPNYKVDAKKYESLKKKIEEELLKEAAAASGDAKPARYINKILKNKLTKSHPILQQAYFNNDKLYFTDSYTGYIMNKKIEGIPIHKEPVNYPTLENVVPDDDASFTIKANKLNEMMALYKDSDIFTLYEKNEFKIYMQVFYIKALINIFNYKKNDDIIFRYKNNNSTGYYNRAFKVVKNDDICILLPVRVE